MKKKFIAIIMAAFMAATLLTGCGDDAEANASAPATEEAANGGAQSDAADPAGGNMVSDEMFAVMQENYAIMVEYHDLIAEAYNSDEIAANPEIETIMNEAADVMVQMGEVRQDMLTEEDAVKLNDLIIRLAEGLTVVEEALEPAGGAEGTPISDETYEILQTNWDTLTDIYNQAATAYNNGEYEKNEDFEKLMNEAADILEEIGGISREELTEENAVEVNNTMILILEGLGEALGLTG